MPPADTDISACIDAVGSLSEVPLAPADDPRIIRLDDEVVERYLAHVRAVRLAPEANDVRVAYTPMHGVGGEVLLRAFAAAGLPAPEVVPAQRAPDPDFPTVSFPNPEEPGAMDLLLDVAPRQRRRRRASPTIPTPTGWAWPSPRRMAAGGRCGVTRSAGCSPTTSSATRLATIASW